jgi:Zn-dependent protease
MNWEAAILMFVTLIISLTVHEAAHAFVAMLGGDRTAYASGQVTLNPLPHIRREPFGTLALPILTLLMTKGNSCLGFAHAPYNAHWAARYPRRAAAMSLAGPVANILLAAVAFAVLWFIGKPSSDTADAVRKIATSFVEMNILLAMFNLLPLPPLDGAGVVGGLVPASRSLFASIERIPYGTLVILVLFANYIHELVWPVIAFVDRWLPWSMFFTR